MGRTDEARPGEAGACYIVRTGPVRGHGGWGGRWHLPRAVVGRMEHSTSMTGGQAKRSAGLVMGNSERELPVEAISV